MGFRRRQFGPFVGVLSTLIVLDIIRVILAQRCYEGAIHPGNTRLASDCVSPESKTTLREPLKSGDEFSTGNLDDFCLRTEISVYNADPSFKRTYEGVGKLSDADMITFPHLKHFPILEKLVQGNTWSYQSEGRIEIGNINWPDIQRRYDEQYSKEVQKLMDEAKVIEADVVVKNRTYQLFNNPRNFFAEAMARRDNWIAIYQGCLNCINACRGSKDYGLCTSICRGCPRNDYEINQEMRRMAFYKKGTDAGHPTVLAVLTTEARNKVKGAEEFKVLLKPLKTLLHNTRRFPTPDYQAENPYFVEVTGIKIDNEILKNYLHIRVFLNRSVSDTRGRLHTPQERRDKTYGRMKGFLLMVKDQEGWPVGSFEHPIPCSKTCRKYGDSVFTHDSRNDLPCSYTPPTATTHPGMFVWPSQDQEKVEGVREVHATWSFAQDSCNFVTELHFQTLIVEDFVERPGTDFFNSKGGSKPVDLARPHFYGWTARYNILHPTRNSLGAADWVSVRELRIMNRRSSNIDCHVPLNDTYGFIKGRVPFDRRSIPTQASYFLQLMSEFPTDMFPDVQYFGQHLNGRLKCRDPIPENNVAKAELETFIKLPSVSEFTKTPGIRCPCPALPTTPDPESDAVTADPNRLHGRLLHASHMALAWMILVPLAFFIARFYKETFSTVFCFQEYWWYMWHVGLMFAATAFIMGGILSITARQNVSKLKKSNLLIVHNVFGALSIIMFYIQIFTGFFRASDPAARIRGIFAHWLVGTLNQASAISCVIMMGFVKQSGMTCDALIVSGVWVVFYLVMFGMMEFNLRVADRRLQLQPPRSYLPPPVMRLFGQDAPGRVFRIVMLFVFITGLIIFYILIINYIWASEGMSCRDQLGEAADEETEIREDNYDYVEEDDSP